MEGKVCNKCGARKHLSEFHKDKKFKDGHYSRCKTCKSEDDKFYREKNKEKLKQKSREYRQQNKIEINERRKIRYEKNKDEINARRKHYEKQYREQNREVIRERHKQWRMKNPKKVRKLQANWNQSEGFSESMRKYKKSEKGRKTDYKSRVKRRSQKHNVQFSPYEREQIFKRDRFKCQDCGIKVHDRSSGNWNTPDKAHIDHILPISKGGNSEPSNLQTLCRTCNLTKHNKVEYQLPLF